MSPSISLTRYRKCELIGKGSFGDVYEGFDEIHNNLIAIKEIDITPFKTDYMTERIYQFEKEIEILSRLSHKNIIKYLGTARTETKFCIFLEFCIGGSLQKKLETYEYFTETVIRRYITQILEGLEYLHAHNVVHRDIKGANILVDRNGICKLSDFGGSKIIIEEFEFIKQLSFRGTVNWMAPEAIRRLEYSRFSDIWSIGCLVIEMATGL